MGKLRHWGLSNLCEVLELADGRAWILYQPVSLGAAARTLGSAPCACSQPAVSGAVRVGSGQVGGHSHKALFSLVL